MPLKLNVSTSRKIGEPNYGSRGATVGLEMELEANLIGQPQRLQERIAHLFRLAKESVDRELTGQASHSANGASENGAMGDHEPAIRRATRRQLSAICAIAGERQIDLPTVLQNRFGHDRPNDLSITEASELIDAMKQTGKGSPLPEALQSPAAESTDDGVQA